MKSGSNPIAWQSQHRQGYHLSDPCIAHNEGELFCFYRESKRISLEVENNTLFAMKYDQTGKKWMGAIEIASSNEDALLSPAFIYDEKGTCFVYYVSRIKGQISLKYMTLSGYLKVEKVSEVRVEGLPEGYNLWHIGIAYGVNRDKNYTGDKSLLGLSLIRNKSNDYKLFFSKSNGVGDIWTLCYELKPPFEVKDDISFVYKSCFIPNTNQYLLSYKDKKNRYKMIVSDLS